jgi:orotate phosphoribosyltransferase
MMTPAEFSPAKNPTPKNTLGGTANITLDMEPAWRELFHLLKTLSFKRGNFTLASGARSTWYMDCRVTALSGRGSLLIGELFHKVMRNENLHPHAIGGMVLGAAPLVTASTVYSASIGRPVDGFLVRKEAKTHGGGKRIEGHLSPQDRVILVEDVVTTGGSTLKAIQAIKQQHPNQTISGVLAMVDRHAGATEAFANQQIPLWTLYGIDAFLQE